MWIPVACCVPTDLDQVHIILNVIGSPSQEDLTSVTSEQVHSTVPVHTDTVIRFHAMMGSYLSQARRYLQSLPPRPAVPWARLYSQADPMGEL